MAAEDKLQNVKAVRQMIDGTHKSQTRKTHGFSDAAATAKRNEKHEIGDIWEETDPKSGTVWKITQFDGFRSKVPANSVREEINEILNVPKTCPTCDQKMKDVDEEHLNLKMYFIHKKCFSCVIKEETLIKAQGKEAWEDYSRKKMLANAKSWMSDVDKEVEELKKAVTETYWQNADGRSEDIDVSAYMKKIDSDYQSLKEEILNNLESKNGN
tara:strand:+ start:2144 stop:2782 length:639 start_codon:yes stop_codon:yes gene_type:complete